MGNIHCPCGNIFSDGEIPCPHEYSLVPNMVMEELTNTVIETVRRGEDVGANVAYLIMTHGATSYKCPVCGRLLVFWNGITNPAQSFKPES